MSKDIGSGCAACILSAKGICDACEALKADLHPPRRRGDSLALAAALLAATRPPFGSLGTPPLKDRAALIPKRKREKRQRTEQEKAERRERKRKNKRRRARRRGR